MYLSIKGTFKKSEMVIDDYVFFFCLIFFIKAYVVGTHLNCINKLMQFKQVPTTYALLMQFK